MDITDKLLALRKGLTDLEHKLQEDDVFSNPSKLKELNQQYAELQAVIELANKYDNLKQQITELQAALRTENEPELKNLT